MTLQVRPAVTGLVRRITADVTITDASGWATRTLERSVRRALLLATAVWQGVMVVACFVAPGPVVDLAWLVAGHAAVLVLALLARGERVPAWLPVLAVYPLFLSDWGAAGSVEGGLLFAALWMMNLVDATPAFVMRGRAALALPVAAVCILPPLMMVVRPDLGPELPVSILVTGVSIIAATRLGMSYLVDAVRGVDRDLEDAVLTRERSSARHAARLVAAESARVVHDTVVNTLAAVASGGPAVTDVVAVRQRARHDLETLDTMLQGRDRDGPAAEGIRLARPGRTISVRHVGLSDLRVAEIEQTLLPAVRHGMSRAVHELVQNAEKHSGASEVTVTTELHEGRLVVTVADDGVGFDGLVPAGRGLERSVYQRAHDAGIEVEMTSAVGSGTSTRLSHPLGAAPDPPATAADDLTGGLAHLRRQASLLYSAGVAAVGLVLALTNHPGELTTEYAMVAIAGLGSWLGWRWSRSGRSLPAAVSVILALGASAAFVCAAAAVDFGRTDAALWQAIGPTGLLVLLAESARSPRTVLRASAVYAAVVVAVALVAGGDDLEVLAVVSTAGAAGLGIVAAWRHFQNLIGSIGHQAAQQQRHAAELRVETGRREAADRAHDRWRISSLDEATALLRRLADGTSQPTDPYLRRLCSQTEAHLRQLTLISPDLVHMGQWLARALDEAHRAGVELVVRTGITDVDETTAGAWGRLVVDTIAATPPETPLTITLFPVPSGVRLTLVGEHPHLATVAARATAVTPVVQTLGVLDVVEVETTPAAPQPVPAG